MKGKRESILLFHFPKRYFSLFLLFFYLLNFLKTSYSSSSLSLKSSQISPIAIDDSKEEESFNSLGDSRIGGGGGQKYETSFYPTTYENDFYHLRKRPSIKDYLSAYEEQEGLHFSKKPYYYYERPHSSLGVNRYGISYNHPHRDYTSKLDDFQDYEELTSSSPSDSNFNKKISNMFYTPPRSSSNDLNSNGLALLGLLGLLSMLSNLMTMITKTATIVPPRKKREITDYSSAKIQFVDYNENMIKNNTNKEKEAFIALSKKLLPYFSIIAHAAKMENSKKIPFECTKRAVCFTNKIIMDQLGSKKGKTISSIIRLAIAKMLKKPDKTLTGSLKDCNKIYNKLCDALKGEIGIYAKHFPLLLEKAWRKQN